MNQTQTSFLLSTRVIKILGFLSFGMGLSVPMLPFVSILMRSYLLRHGLLGIIPFSVVEVVLATTVIVHPASSLSSKILAIIGMLSSVIGIFFAPLLFSFH